MAKSEWESRVGKLLDPLSSNTQFFYSYKPPDYKSGGQPRVDWLACDISGFFWMIEVKMLPETRRGINLGLDVTAGQRDALDLVAQSDGGYALLAVGRGSELYFFNWRRLASWVWLEAGSRSIEWDQSFLILTWTGSKMWSRYDLRALVDERLHPTNPLRIPPARP